MNVKPQISNTFPCSYCTKNFETLDLLLAHEAEHEKNFDNGASMTTRDEAKQEEINLKEE